MPRIPGPAEIADTPLRQTRRAVQVRADRSGEALSQIGAAAGEAINRIRDAQIESEVRSADLEYALDLDKTRRELEADNDYETYEQRFQTRAGELRAQYGERLRSPMHRRLWDARAQQREAQETVAVRDLARRKGVEGAVAGVVRQDALVRQIIDDEGVPDDVEMPDGTVKGLRAESVSSYRDMVRNMVGRGILGADDGERMVSALEGYYRNKTEDRSVVAGAQRASDTVFANPELTTLDQKLDWVRENVPAGRLRDAAEDEVAQRWGREQTSKSQTRQEAADQAWTMIYEGQSPDSLPADVKAALNGYDLARMRRYVLNEARGGQAQIAADGAARMGELADMAANNQRVFVKMDLNEERAGLSRAQFARLQQLQQKVKGDLESGRVNPEQQATTRIQALGRNYAAAAGLDLKPEQRRQLNAHLARYILEFSEANDGAVPDGDQMKAIVQGAVTEGRNKRYVFETSDTRRVRVPYDDIPAEDRNFLIEQARAERSKGYGSLDQMRWGMTGQISQREIEERYADMLSLRRRGGPDGQR